MFFRSPLRSPSASLQNPDAVLQRPESRFHTALFTTVDFTEDNFRTGYRQFETSRRMFSIRTDRCSSPRPETRTHRRLRFLLRAAQRCVPVLVQTIQDLTRRYELTFFTAEREVLTQKNIETVGSSTESAGTLQRFACRKRCQKCSVRQDPDRHDIASFRQIGFDTFQTEVPSTLPTFALRVLPSLSMIVTVGSASLYRA